MMARRLLKEVTRRLIPRRKNCARVQEPPSEFGGFG
jgi:hypothetical protein